MTATPAFPYETRYGLPFPDWEAVMSSLGVTYESQTPDAWRPAIETWADLLLAALGEGYAITRSDTITCVSWRPKKDAASVAKFARRCAASITEDFIRKEDRAPWPVMIIDFHDNDRYYDYVAGLRPSDDADEEVASSGCCITSGYAHVLLNNRANHEAAATIAHELVHLTLVEHDLPLWLEEGVAMFVESRLAGSGQFYVDHELVARHQELWRGEGLDAFWFGEAFSDPERSELAYHLAELLVRNLYSDNKKQLRAFIAAARHEDAGEAAARDTMGRGITDVAAGFLGDRPWAPA